MSWRRFLVLLKCLSPSSATIAHLTAERFLGQRDTHKINVVAGAKAAQRAFEALFKPPPKRARPAVHSR